MPGTLKTRFHMIIVGNINVGSIMHLLFVLHSPLGWSWYSPGWHSQVMIPEADVTVRILSGHAQVWPLGIAKQI